MTPVASLVEYDVLADPRGEKVPYHSRRVTFTLDPVLCARQLGGRGVKVGNVVVTPLFAGEPYGQGDLL